MRKCMRLKTDQVIEVGVLEDIRARLGRKAGNVDAEGVDVGEAHKERTKYREK
jgi:hypothetical protein